LAWVAAHVTPESVLPIVGWEPPGLAEPVQSRRYISELSALVIGPLQPVLPVWVPPPAMFQLIVPLAQTRVNTALTRMAALLAAGTAVADLRLGATPAQLIAATGFDTAYALLRTHVRVSGLPADIEIGALVLVSVAPLLDGFGLGLSMPRIWMSMTSFWSRFSRSIVLF
jgi:hypothetical protein